MNHKIISMPNDSARRATMRMNLWMRFLRDEFTPECYVNLLWKIDDFVLDEDLERILK